MKRTLSFFLATVLTLSLLPGSAQAALDSRVEKAISWAIAIANDDRHGYSQVNRTGPDYDCSSFVSTAFKQGGFDIDENNWTGSMEAAFKSVGFKAYAAGSVTLQRGDILLHPVNHVELYLGNNQCVAAHQSETADGITGKAGDQTGQEIDVRSKANCNFCKYQQYTRVLRYEGGSSSSSGSPSSTPTVKENFSCNVQINTTKGKTVNLYKNPGDTSRSDYFDQGQTAYSTKGAKMSDGSTWYQVQALQGSTVVTLWLNAASSGVSVINKSVALSMSFSPSSVTVKPGGSATVSINFKGDGIYKLNYDTNNSNIAASWGSVDYSKGTTSLTVTGKTPGTTTLTVNLVNSAGTKLYSKSFNVTVSNYSATLSASPPSLSLDLVTKPSQTVTITLGGTYPGDGSASVAVDTSGVATGAWISGLQNKQAQMTVSAKEVGTGSITYKMVNKSSGQVYASTTVNVTATAPTYTVTYNANYGTGAPAKQTKEYNKSVTLSSQKPTRPGYQFNGWLDFSKGDRVYQPGDTFSENRDLHLDAAWAPASGVQYTVKHYLKRGNDVILDSVDTLTGTTGETVSPTPKEYTGYSTPTQKSAAIQADGNTVIEYTYTAKIYDVILRDGRGIVSVTGGGTYMYGDVVTVDAKVAEGYEWYQWTSSASKITGSLDKQYTFTMPDEEVVLLATANELPEPDCSDGHTWGEWNITQESTCERGGRQERTCKVCGEREREQIEALGHRYEIKQETDNYVLYACANCGDISIEEREGFAGSETDRAEKREEPDDTQDWERTDDTQGRKEPDDMWDRKDPDDTQNQDNPSTSESGDTWNQERPSKPQTSGMGNFMLRNYYSDGIFCDVAEKYWAGEYIEKAYCLGLMQGMGGGYFSPDNHMTLAEAITLAARIHRIYYTGSDTFSFYDSGNWYDPYVNYARENGIIYENYNYTRPATREEFCHIMAKALPEEELENITGAIDFLDSADIIYMGDVRLLSRAGVIFGSPGDGGLYFLPNNAISRAEVSAIVTRIALPAFRKGN